MPEHDASPERRPEPAADQEEAEKMAKEPVAGQADAEGEQTVWDAYWDRFRRQQVDDPVEENREGYWERFRRQQVDDPVSRRRRSR